MIRLLDVVDAASNRSLRWLAVREPCAPTIRTTAMDESQKRAHPPFAVGFRAVANHSPQRAFVGPKGRGQ